MFDWADLRVFLAAYRTGSISRTAAELGTSVSTASRRLTTLENAVGKPLFARTPSGLRPTPAAEAMHPHAERTEKSALAAVSAVRVMAETPKGAVTLALPSDMMLLVLLPQLKPLLDAYPEICLSLVQGNVLADLTRLEADIAVRVIRPTHGEELIWTRLREVPIAAFATAEVLEGIDDPTDPHQHRWIGWLEDLPGEGRIEGMGCVPSLRCNSPATIRHAAAAGLGTAFIPRLFGRLTPSLVEAPIPSPAPAPLYMITHRAVRHEPRVSVIWDALDALLREEDGFSKLAAGIKASYSVHGITEA